MDVETLRIFDLDFENAFSDEKLNVHHNDYKEIKDFVNLYGPLVTLVTGIEMKLFETTDEKEENYKKVMQFHTNFTMAHSRIHQLNRYVQ